MIFEEKAKKLNYIDKERKVQVRIDLEPKRENELQKINKVYSYEVFNNEKKIGRTKLIKMAVDNLINDLEVLSEDEGVQYLRNLYKDAEF